MCPDYNSHRFVTDSLSFSTFVMNRHPMALLNASLAVFTYSCIDVSWAANVDENPISGMIRVIPEGRFLPLFRRTLSLRDTCDFEALGFQNGPDSRGLVTLNLDCSSLNCCATAALLAELLRNCLNDSDWKVCREIMHDDHRLASPMGSLSTQDYAPQFPNCSRALPYRRRGCDVALRQTGNLHSGKGLVKPGLRLIRRDFLSWPRTHGISFANWTAARNARFRPGFE
jgi:hypothetical protein